MAWTEQFPAVTVVGERTQRALRMPFGMASPLWAMFGAAASAGIAYWWMTSWTRAVNVEAFAPFAVKAPPATPIEIVAAETRPAPATMEATRAPAEPDVVAETLAELAAAEADDLTRMVGIGPKLAAALAERGVTRFAQIAAWSQEDLAEIDVALSLKGRAVREAWVSQAKRLAGED
jgi:predicted flap endonuclease-1-like 5' DNA nuclease